MARPSVSRDPFWWIDTPPRRRRGLLGLTVARWRRLGWAIGVVTALAVGLAAHSVVADAERALADYGARIEVAVARHDLEPGMQIASRDVRIIEAPAGLVPDDARDDPIGRTVAQRIVEGEPVRAARLGPAGAHGLAAQLRPDERAVALDPTAIGLELRPGDEVTLVVATPWDQLDPLSGGERGPARHTTVPARVLERTDTAAVVAVPADRAGEVALAAQENRVALALRPPGAD